MSIYFASYSGRIYYHRKLVKDSIINTLYAAVTYREK
jgi:hypothetical protein